MTKLTTGPDDDQQISDPGTIDSDASSEYTETDSGLKYRILRKGDGAMPKSSDTVEVHYKGWLEDGSIFDSSYRRGETISFPLNGVIPGWTEGMQLVGQGGMIELQIPSDLGYGPRGMPPVIPGGATLEFLVELVEIK
jgi:FKBP-type peptidyl-prolyl cis-trans isomerase